MLRTLLLSFIAGSLFSCTYSDRSSSETLRNQPTSRTNYLSGYGPASGTTYSNGSPAAQAYWDGDSVTGPPKIKINRDEQKAYFYKGGQLVGVSPISSGDSKHITPRGSFKITQKHKDHASSLYGVFRDTTTGEVIDDDVDTRKKKAPRGAVYEGAPMPHFMRFNGGIGLHAGHLPGYPASHGCVRMPAHMAKTFFEHAKLGTPVIVE